MVQTEKWKFETESLFSAAQKQALNTNSVRKICLKDVSIKCRSCRTHVGKRYRQYKIRKIMVQTEKWKFETESLFSAAQKQALNTNSVRKICLKDVSIKCRSCRTHVENILHTVSDSSMLAQKEYKRRHDKLCLNIHWALFKKYGVKVCERWYEHKVGSVIKNDMVKIRWDVCSQVDTQIEYKRPDIVVMAKNTNNCLIIDVACPADSNLILKRNEKLDKYSEL